jgi:hypothetical protein
MKQKYEPQIMDESDVIARLREQNKALLAALKQMVSLCIWDGHTKAMQAALEAIRKAEASDV